MDIVASVTFPETVVLPSNAYLINPWSKNEIDTSFDGYQFDSKPMVRRRYPSKSLTSGENRTDVTGWDQFFLDINYEDQARNSYVRDVTKFCFNTQGWPRMASVDTGNNIVLVEKSEEGWSKIQTLILQDGVPDITKVNRTLTPWFIHRLVIVTRDYRFVDVPNRGDCYFPVVLDAGKEAWMPSSYLTKVGS